MLQDTKHVQMFEKEWMIVDTKFIEIDWKMAITAQSVYKYLKNVEECMKVCEEFTSEFSSSCTCF